MSIPFSAGSLVSNIEDMLKFYKGLLSGQVSSLDLLNKACTSATLSNGDFAVFNTTGTGYGNTTSAVNAVQFTMSSGTIDSGTIEMYGIN